MYTNIVRHYTVSCKVPGSLLVRFAITFFLVPGQTLQFVKVSFTCDICVATAVLRCKSQNACDSCVRHSRCVLDFVCLMLGVCFLFSRRLAWGTDESSPLSLFCLYALWAVLVTFLRPIVCLFVRSSLRRRNILFTGLFCRSFVRPLRRLVFLSAAIYTGYMLNIAYTLF